MFESKPAINQHVAFVHKKALLELENQKSAPVMPLCEPLFEPENQKTATASATQTSVNENPEWNKKENKKSTNKKSLLLSIHDEQKASANKYNLFQFVLF